ncbi:MAG: hypothetical protein ACRDHZ_04695, partial [Ktedonobacteraceae bacterium]
VHALQKQALAAHRQGDHEQMVELITSQEAGRQIYDQMHRTAQHEIITLLRPPMLISRLDVSPDQDEQYQREAQARGVLYRSIVDADFMVLPGAVQRIKDDMKAGEEVRVILHLPFKMALVDGRLAFVPLNLQRLDSPSLLVRSSALLDAFCALFEILWERAAPISFAHGGVLEIGDSSTRLSKEAKDLVTLLATGLNDKKIAGELHISQRTLERRIAELMRSLDTRTRFQTGWLAALRLSGATLPPDA